jgi:hypothetical protein
MEKRYNALRVIATIYKVLGIVVAIVTVLAVIGFCAFSVLGGAAMGSLGRDATSGLLSGVFGGFLFAIIGIIYGGGIALTLFAAGEGISLLIALEENTRVTAMALQQRNP